MVVFNLDSLKFAYLFALFASDTSVGAGFSCLCARILGVALNDNLVLCRSNADNMVRALLCTDSAAYAHFSVNNGNTVAHFDCAIRTCCFAVSQSHTSVSTSAETSE